MNNWKQVKAEEWNMFLINYPKPLVEDIVRICEPALLNYNDFSDGRVWPESMVAKRTIENDPRYFLRESGED